MPRLSLLHRHHAHLSPLCQPNCDVKEVKISLSQTEEKASNKKADKYRKEFDRFGEKEHDDRQSSFSSENVSHLCKEAPVKEAEVSDGECTNKNLDQGDGKDNLTKNGDTNIPKNDSAEDDKCATVPLKKPLAQNEPLCSPTGVRISVNGGTVMLKTLHIQHESVLKRAKSYVPVDLEKSSKQEERDDGHCSSTGEGPPPSEGISSGETRSIPPVEASPSDKETPVQQEQSTPNTTDLDTSAPSEAHFIPLVEASPSEKEIPFHQEERAPDTTDPEASTPSEAAGSRTVVDSAVPEEGIVARDIESSNPVQKNQHESMKAVFI